MSFTVSYDYRCPFARNAHEHVLVALRSGAPWAVDFLPFSLTESHREEGSPAVWDNPDRASDLLAVEAGLVVKERWPDLFYEVHDALFAARHDEGRDLRSEAVVRDVLESSGIDADSVFEEISVGWPREKFRSVHEKAVEEHSAFGVPTFVTDGQAMFVRIMTRPSGDPSTSVDAIERILGLLTGHPELNELKRPTIPR
jgi:DSBA-like thioredoxin domain